MNPVPILLIFFDTEFTELGIDPRLISIGFISQDGQQELYAELTDTYELSNCSDFACEAVIPLLEGGAALVTMHQLCARLTQWLETFDQPVKLVADSLAWDWPWISEIFAEPNSWPDNLDGIPLILERTLVFNTAVERAFSTGLRRHHALDDAKANLFGYLESTRIGQI